MRWIAVLVALAAAGCVSVTAPVPTGPDSYMIGLGARGGFQTDADLMSQTLKAANEFCAQTHRMMVVQSTSSAGTQGWTPQSNQVLFRCVTPS